MKAVLTLVTINTAAVLAFVVMVSSCITPKTYGPDVLPSTVTSTTTASSAAPAD